MTKICISTSLGDVLAEIYEEKAPRTAAHFLRYVDEGHYNGAGFYRTARSRDNQPIDEYKIDVIEGGFTNDYYTDALKVCFDMPSPYEGGKGPIAPRMATVESTDETGLKHVDATLSLGRTDKDAVDDSIVVCVGDNPHLDAGGQRHPDGLGFSAFGRVVEGMEIVRRIHESPAEGQLLKNRIEIHSIKRTQ